MATGCGICGAAGSACVGHHEKGLVRIPEKAVMEQPATHYGKVITKGRASLVRTNPADAEARGYELLGKISDGIPSLDAAPKHKARPAPKKRPAKKAPAKKAAAAKKAS